MFDDREYQLARREHAFLLRAEGLKWHEIAARMGVNTTEGARCLAAKFSYRIARAMRRTTWRIE